MSQPIIDVTNLSNEALIQYVLNFLVENPHQNWVKGEKLFTVCLDNPNAIIFDNNFSQKPYSTEAINIIANTLTSANFYDGQPLHIDHKFCTHANILDGYKWSLKQQVREQICKYHLTFECAETNENELNDRTIHSRYHSFTLTVKDINENPISLSELALYGPVATNSRSDIAKVQKFSKFIKEIPKTLYYILTYILLDSF